MAQKHNTRFWNHSDIIQLILQWRGLECEALIFNLLLSSSYLVQSLNSQMGLEERRVQRLDYGPSLLVFVFKISREQT